MRHNTTGTLIEAKVGKSDLCYQVLQLTFKLHSVQLAKDVCGRMVIRWKTNSGETPKGASTLALVLGEYPRNLAKLSGHELEQYMQPYVGREFGVIVGEIFLPNRNCWLLDSAIIKPMG